MISTVAEWIIWSLWIKVSKVLAMCLCVSRSGSQGVPKAPLGFRTIFWGWVPCGSRFWSLSRTLTRTTATIFPYDNQGSRAVYGHTTKKAVSGHVFFFQWQKEGRSGDPHFWTQNSEFWRPSLFTSLFLWKPIHRREGYMPEKEEMDLIDVVQHRDSWVWLYGVCCAERGHF